MRIAASFWPRRENPTVQRAAGTAPFTACLPSSVVGVDPHNTNAHAQAGRGGLHILPMRKNCFLSSCCCCALAAASATSHSASPRYCRQQRSFLAVHRSSAFASAAAFAAHRKKPLRGAKRYAAAMAHSAKSSSIASGAASGGGGDTMEMKKPRILCLHGRHQSGAVFSNKIAGARRKLERSYDLHFLDGPIRLNGGNDDDDDNDDDGEEYGADEEEEPALFAWWSKDPDTGEHTLVREGMEYVLQHVKEQQREPYSAVIGFSQGGVLATALCCSGLLGGGTGGTRGSGVRAVVTAGSPMVEEAFAAAAELMAADSNNNNNNNGALKSDGYGVPKLHLAGENDAMIPVESTRELCRRGGCGKLLVHDQGHLFPTRSARVKEILDFLEETVTNNNEEEPEQLQQQR